MNLSSSAGPQQTVDLIRAYYAAFNRGDWVGMLACMSEEVVHDVNQGGREVGRMAFATFLQRMDNSYREQLRDVMVMTSADGARAAAEYAVHGEYIHTDGPLPPANGQRYVLSGGAFFDVSEGVITRVSSHYNLQDWLAQISG